MSLTLFERPGIMKQIFSETESELGTMADKAKVCKTKFTKKKTPIKI